MAVLSFCVSSVWKVAKLPMMFGMIIFVLA